eukprot:CFRG3511T1
MAQLLPSAYTLTAEEATATRQLIAACHREGLAVHSTLEMAMYVIVTKLDVSTALNRVKKIRKAAALHNTHDIGAEEALQYMVKLWPSIFLPGGVNKDGTALLCMVYKDCIPSELDAHGAKGKECLVIGLLHYMQLSVCDLDQAREGVSFVTDCKDFGWKNFSLEMEEELAFLYQDGAPIRIRSMLMLDGPFLMRVILNLCKVFLKKKLRDRIMLCERKNLSAHVDSDQLPTEIGGSYQTTIDDWIKDRTLRWEQAKSLCQLPNELL